MLLVLSVAIVQTNIKRVVLEDISFFDYPPPKTHKRQDYFSIGTIAFTCIL